MVLVRGAPLLLSLSLLLAGHDPTHTHLRSSVPAAGSELTDLPEEIRLTFSEAITHSLTQIELSGPAGAVPLSDPVQAPDSPQVVVARVTGPLEAGQYQVRWRTAGRDGHPVNGDFGFGVSSAALAGAAARAELDSVLGGAGGVKNDAGVVLGGAVGPSSSPGSAEQDEPVIGASVEGFGVGSPLFALVRLLGFVGVLGVVGATSFRYLVLSRIGRGGDGVSGGGRRLVDSIGVAPARLGLGFAGLLALSLVLHLIAQGYALGGGILDIGGLNAMLGGTLWGLGWALQAVAVVLVAVGFRRVLRQGSGGWELAGAGVVLLALASGFGGHAVGLASGVSVAIVANAGHLLGAGSWIGGLVLLVGVGLPAALRLEEGSRGEALTALIRGFSGLALVSASIVVVTGVISAWLHLGGPAALWESGYGRALLLKLGLVVLVVGAGAFNFLRLGPRADSGGGARRLRRSGAIELAIAVVVLVVTSVLVALPTPGQ